jgi:hypothetical protein
MIEDVTNRTIGELPYTPSKVAQSLRCRLPAGEDRIIWGDDTIRPGYWQP